MICIGAEGPDQIRIHVADIDRGKVRIGVECPRHIPIYRAELPVGKVDSIRANADQATEGST